MAFLSIQSVTLPPLTSVGDVSHLSRRYCHFDVVLFDATRSPEEVPDIAIGDA